VILRSFAGTPVRAWPRPGRVVRLQYMAPRLREMGRVRIDSAAEIGGKGAGESSIELDRRKIAIASPSLTSELTSLAAEQDTQRARRRDMSRVPWWGYTNAGKSTLMRGLTRQRGVRSPTNCLPRSTHSARAHARSASTHLWVSDTVRFHRPSCRTAWSHRSRARSDEALEAGLLAHVVDASDPGFARQSTSPRGLADIGAADIPRLIIFTRSIALVIGGRSSGGARAYRALARGVRHVGGAGPRTWPGLRMRLCAFFSRDLVQGEVVCPTIASSFERDIRLVRGVGANAIRRTSSSSTCALTPRCSNACAPPERAGM